MASRLGSPPSRGATRGSGGHAGGSPPRDPAIMKQYMTRIADDVVSMELPRDDRPGIIQELERSRWLTAQMLDKVEKLSRQYSEAKDELALLTFAEEETLKISRLHVKVVERELRNVGKDPVVDEVVKETDNHDNDRSRLLRENILEHQKRVKHDLHKELLEKRLVLSHKRERNEQLRAEIKHAVERGYSRDDEDARESSRRRRARARKEEVTDAVAATERPMNEWLQGLRGHTRVPLASVLTGGFPGYGEAPPSQLPTPPPHPEPSVVGTDTSVTPPQPDPPAPADDESQADDVMDVREYTELLAQLQETMQVGIEAKRLIHKQKQQAHERPAPLRDAIALIAASSSDALAGSKKDVDKDPLVVPCTPKDVCLAFQRAKDDA